MRESQFITIMLQMYGITTLILFYNAVLSSMTRFTTFGLNYFKGLCCYYGGSLSTNLGSINNMSFQKELCPRSVFTS